VLDFEYPRQQAICLRIETRGIAILPRGRARHRDEQQQARTRVTAGRTAQDEQQQAHESLQEEQSAETGEKMLGFGSGMI